MTDRDKKLRSDPLYESFKSRFRAYEDDEDGLELEVRHAHQVVIQAEKDAVDEYRHGEEADEDGS